MALTKISTGGVKDDAVSADKLAKPIDLADNEKVRLGTGNDLEIYHDGSNAYITNNTGHVELNSSWRWADNARVRCGASSDLEIYHDGSHSYIKNGQGSLKICDTNVELMNAAADEYMLKAIQDGTVELYYDNVKTFATDPNGIFVYGPEGGSALIRLYADEGDDNADRWRILNDHSSSNNFNIQNYSTGSWVSGLTLDSSNNATFAGTVSDSKGNLRSIPVNTQGSGHYYTVASDAGKCIHSATGGVTITNNIMAAGDAITIVNNSGSDQTITQASGLTMYNTADQSTGNRTLAGRGMATIWFASASVAYISGAGLS